jgi:hypothetical protein
MSSKREHKPTQKVMGKNPLAPLTEDLKKTRALKKAAENEKTKGDSKPVGNADDFGEFPTFIVISLKVSSRDSHCINRR